MNKKNFSKWKFINKKLKNKEKNNINKKLKSFKKQKLNKKKINNFFFFLNLFLKKGKVEKEKEIKRFRKKFFFNKIIKYF
jgi:hypothetical protein